MDPVWKTFGYGMQDWPGSRIIGTELQAVFKIRIRSDFENLKERIRNPESNENDTLDPNPHQTKMSDHDPLPS